jgi:nucleoside-diphosphate-sugar epimerase
MRGDSAPPLQSLTTPILPMTDYLITGGAGFIGSNITEHLVRNGKSVRVLDNFLTGKPDNLRAVANDIELIRGDLRNPDDCRRAVAGIRYILHLGALPSVPRSVADPQTSHDINVTGTLNLLIAARDAHCQRLVFSSSSSVYGNTPTLPKHEAMTPAPLSPYAAHKLIGEHYCRIFCQLYKLQTVSLRYFNVFGPRQDPKSEYAAVIPRFITAILHDQTPVIFGDGTQTRDFTFVENVIAANLAACVAPDAACGESCNAACGDRTSLLDLVGAINKTLGKHISPRLDPPRPGDVLHSQAANQKARDLLHWTPRINFADGIAKTIAWYRQQSA